MECNLFSACFRRNVSRVTFVRPDEFDERRIRCSAMHKDFRGLGVGSRGNFRDDRNLLNGPDAT